MSRDYRHVHKSATGYHNHHLNDVRPHEGALYATTKTWNGDGDRSAVIRLDPDSLKSEFFVEPGGFPGMHDGVFIDGRFYVTQSGSNSIGWREADGSVVSRRLEPSPYFVRGLCASETGFLVGFTPMRGSNLPACIVEFDRKFERQKSSMDLSEYGTYPGTAIHAITIPD